MKIVINNVPFEYNNGVKVLKLKGGKSPFEEIADIWDDIVPMEFSEIARLENLEQRRIAINFMGIDRLISQVKPKLLDKQVIKKKTTWINEFGVEETIKFDDVYELYEVSGKVLFKGLNDWEQRNNYHYVKFKDTSTDREYMIWVDLTSVLTTNGGNRWNFEEEKKKITATQCIAWTITTNVAEGNIEKIVRQGDCILIKPKKRASMGGERHLTEKEYLKFLKIES